MTVLSTLYKHRNKLIYAAIGSISLYLLNSFISNKIKEFQSKSQLDAIIAENIQKRFTQNQRDCDITCLSLLEVLKAKLPDLEKLTEKLRLRPEKEEKEELWERIKEISFLRYFGAVFGVCFLFMLLKVQMNLLGRFAYMDSIDKDSKDEDGKDGKSSLPADVEKMYLSLSWYFLYIGFPEVLQVIESEVVEYFKENPVALTVKISSEEVTGHLNGIFKRITESLGPFEKIVLPPSVDVQKVITAGITNSSSYELPTLLTIPDQVYSLFEETQNIVSSPETTILLKRCLTKTMEPKFEPSNKPFASYFPVLNKIAINEILESSNNQYVKELASMAAVDAFAAVVYAGFEK